MPSQGEILQKFFITQDVFDRTNIRDNFRNNFDQTILLDKIEIKMAKYLLPINSDTSSKYPQRIYSLLNSKVYII